MKAFGRRKLKEPVEGITAETFHGFQIIEPVLRNAVGGREKGSNDCAPVAVVAATTGVDEDAGREVVGILAGEVECSDEAGQVCETADVDVFDTALPECFAFGEVVKKGPMVFLQVGIPVPTRALHAGDIDLQPGVRIVGSGTNCRAVELDSEEVVDGVVACREELMVVHAALPPILCLVVQDLASLIAGAVVAAPQDAVGVWVARRLVALQQTVITVEGSRIVIPVDAPAYSFAKRGLVWMSRV